MSAVFLWLLGHLWGTPGDPPHDVCSLHSCPHPQRATSPGRTSRVLGSSPCRGVSPGPRELGRGSGWPEAARAGGQEPVSRESGDLPSGVETGRGGSICTVESGAHESRLFPGELAGKRGQPTPGCHPHSPWAGVSGGGASACFHWHPHQRSGSTRSECSGRVGWGVTWGGAGVFPRISEARPWAGDGVLLFCSWTRGPEGPHTPLLSFPLLPLRVWDGFVPLCIRAASSTRPGQNLGLRRGLCSE